MQHTMELLAPVGNWENFFAALEAGADAVYVGAPGINARNLSRDLSLVEIAAMVAMIRDRGKKIYLAANSLISEKELPELLDTLAVVEELAPDALIVQDLGLLRLVRQYFPRLTLHASTLMTAHSIPGVKLLARLGCKRVVLARELSLVEIGAIAEACPEVELEVFIHGAMCFSYSGLCLFSSALGGKSGLRGRCVQPCRRGYSQEGQGAPRYIFSMNDLSGIAQVEELRKLGIASLKIEGRLRSANYVRSVVSAYRLVMDAPVEQSREALARAEVLIEGALSRKTTSGFFTSIQPQDAIVPFHSGGMGLHLGRFSTVRAGGGGVVCRFVTKHGLQVGDRLRLHREPSGERVSFRLRTMHLQGAEATLAEPGSKVSLALPEDFVMAGAKHVDVYKTDTASDAEAGGKRPDLAVFEQKVTVIRKRVWPHLRDLQQTVLPPVLAVADAAPGGKRPGKKKGRDLPDIWLKGDSLKLLSEKLPFRPQRYLLTMEHGLARQASKVKAQLGREAGRVIWCLPPVLHDQALGLWHKRVMELLKAGFRTFQLGHVSQLPLFFGHKTELYLDHPGNVLNSQAVEELRDLGFAGIQLAMEMDRELLASLLAGPGVRAAGQQQKGQRGRMLTGLTVFGKIPLYTARLEAEHFQLDTVYQSPKKEEYTLRKGEGYIQALPVRPFSILPWLEELKTMGLNYAVVDTTGMKGTAREMRELGERLANSGRYGKLPTFNYLGRLE